MQNFDHLVYAVSSLEEGIANLKELLGVEAVIGGKHKIWGTHNALIGLGPKAYLEIIAIDPTAPVPQKRSVGVERKDLPRITAWVMQSSDMERQVAEAKKVGFWFEEPHEFSREKPDGGMLRWKLSMNEYPGFHGGLIPFLIDWGKTPHPSEKAPQGCTLLSLRGEHPDPQKIEKVFSALGVTMKVTKGSEPKLIAHIRSPKGDVYLH